MPNRLANESSLYLKQHAENPVDWWPWCDEAFEEAERLNKPVLISIGYSSCHWCHVMAHQCFEDEYIAKLMNTHFINIKVDREERPDVDQIYMDAVQMITQHGGWPLNVFCLPDGRPFFGGTYFPPDDGAGHQVIPWPQLLMRISEHYKRSPEDLAENADSILKNITYQSNASRNDEEEWSPLLIQDAVKFVLKDYDPQNGGFGGSPKFPPSMKLSLLLSFRYSKACEADSALSTQIDRVIQNSLIKMGSGGLFDQVGCGFARYSVDARWEIPHFEKMLYDNGMLLDIYSRAYSRYGNPLFKDIIEDTMEWLVREMLAPDGSFYSSLDADSEGEEGKFYVWNPQEIKQVLGDRSEAFCEAYSISEEGNFEHGKSNPVLKPEYITRRAEFVEDRKKLLEARENRIRPGKDTKRLVSWNALLLRGIAEASYALDRSDWFQLADGIVSWIESQMRGADGGLHSVYYDDKGACISAYLDDYVFYSEALLMLSARSELYAAGSSTKYLEIVRKNANYIIAHFKDPHQVGYYFTSDLHENRVIRRKDWFDNAIPTGNSGLMHLFSSLYILTGDPVYEKELEASLPAYNAYVRNVPHGVTHALAGLTDYYMGIGVLKVIPSKLDEVKGLLNAKPWRKLFVQVVNESEIPGECQLCVGTTCLSENTLEEIKEKL